MKTYLRRALKGPTETHEAKTAREERWETHKEIAYGEETDSQTVAVNAPSQSGSGARMGKNMGRGG